MTDSQQVHGRKREQGGGEPTAETTPETPTRRQWITLCGGAALTGLAGCSEDGGSGGGGGGSGDGSAGSDESTDGAAGDSSGDGSSDGGGDASGSGESFGDVLQFESSFRMDGYVEQEGGPRNEMQGRIDGNDSYWRFESDGEVSEIYAVDGNNYIVSGEDCLLNRDAGSQGFTTDQFEEDRSKAPDVTPSGQGTIDGTDVLVYEFTSGENEVTYYLDAQTGYPVRVETANGAFNFSAWGDVEPVTTPDMECQDPSQGGA